MHTADTFQIYRTVNPNKSIINKYELLDLIMKLNHAKVLSIFFTLRAFAHKNGASYFIKINYCYCIIIRRSGAFMFYTIGYINITYIVCIMKIKNKV